MSRFDAIRQTNAKLAKALAKAQKMNASSVTSGHDVITQVHALHDTFRALRISKLVTAKVGSWYRRTPLVDVVVDFADLQPNTGEEAGEMAKLMNESFEIVRQILAAALPGMTQFAPTEGICAGAWRFQC